MNCWLSLVTYMASHVRPFLLSLFCCTQGAVKHATDQTNHLLFSHDSHSVLLRLAYSLVVVRTTR